MNFETLEPAILSLVRTLTGLPAEMLDDNKTKIAPAKVRVSIFALSSIGTQDEVSYVRTPGTYGAGAPAGSLAGGAEHPATETAIGRRELTIRMRCESTFQSPGKAARQYLEAARTRIRLSTSRAAFRAAGLGFQSVETLTDLSAPLADAGRVQSVCVLDIRCNVISTATAVDPIPTIERASPPRKG